MGPPNYLSKAEDALTYFLLGFDTQKITFLNEERVCRRWSSREKLKDSLQNDNYLVDILRIEVFIKNKYATSLSFLASC